jgi:endonuclease/exonuclease/phosphatase family metal-dependent hydrolase
LRVVTFNIKDGGRHRENFIIEVLTAVQPDLILLQEVTHPNLVQDLATRFKMEFAIAKGHSLRHVALLSHYLIRSSVSSTPVPGLSRDFLAATIEFPPRQTLAVFVVHLAAQPFAIFEWLRQLEIRSVLRYANRFSALPCLLAGDFNSVGPMDRPITKTLSWHVKLMLFLQANRFPHRVIHTVQTAQFFDCFRLLHTDPGYTLPPPVPTVRFDYLFANSSLKSLLQNCFVVQHPQAVEFASDHYPLAADFAL